MNIQQFKRELSRVFDDNLHTKQWHNYVDYAIIGLIILSTIEVRQKYQDHCVGVQRASHLSLQQVLTWAVIACIVGIQLCAWESK